MEFSKTNFSPSRTNMINQNLIKVGFCKLLLKFNELLEGPKWGWEKELYQKSSRPLRRDSDSRLLITRDSNEGYPKVRTRAFSWLKAATTAFTFKTLLRHYAKRVLTPRSQREIGSATQLSWGTGGYKTLCQPNHPSLDFCVADPISRWGTVG